MLSGVVEGPLTDENLSQCDLSTALCWTIC